MAKKAAKAASRRKKPATERRGPKVGVLGLSGHRDPIVADNADVKINFTQPPVNLDEGKLWARRFTAFKQLDAKFDGRVEPTRQLKAVSTLTFAYSKPNQSSIDEKLEFISTGHGAVLVSVKEDKLRHIPLARRFLVPATLHGLRLRSVTGQDHVGAPFTVDLFDGNAPKFTNVTITIVPQDE